jgi:hypothetical protein
MVQAAACIGRWNLPGAIVLVAASECDGHHRKPYQSHDGLAGHRIFIAAERMDGRLVVNLQQLVHKEAAWHRDRIAFVCAGQLIHDFSQHVSIVIVEHGCHH